MCQISVNGVGRERGCENSDLGAEPGDAKWGGSNSQRNVIVTCSLSIVSPTLKSFERRDVVAYFTISLPDPSAKPVGLNRRKTHNKQIDKSRFSEVHPMLSIGDRE